MIGDEVARLDAVLAEVESIADSATRSTALSAVQGLLELYGQGLARIIELVGPEAHAALAADDHVAHLLLLHGLHPVDLTSRVRAALDSVRPYLESHGGNVELLGVQDGLARLRLRGTCNGCASSETTLKGLIEKAIGDAAPDLDGIETEATDAVANGSFVALECLSPAR